jgi:hypothetical protein
MNNQPPLQELSFLLDKIKGGGATPGERYRAQVLLERETERALRPHLPAMQAAVRRRHEAREAARAAAREAGNAYYRRWLARRNTRRY